MACPLALLSGGVRSGRRGAIEVHASGMRGMWGVRWGVGGPDGRVEGTVGQVGGRSGRRATWDAHGQRKLVVERNGRTSRRLRGACWLGERGGKGKEGLKTGGEVLGVAVGVEGRVAAVWRSCLHWTSLGSCSRHEHESPPPSSSPRRRSRWAT